MNDQDLIKRIMQDTRYSQASIASFIGVTRQYVNLVYKGKSNLSPQSKSRLRDKFPQYFEIAKIPTELNAESIKKFRLDNQYTQTRFANMLEIAQTTLARIESGDLAVSKQVKNNFYRVFSKENDTQSVYYCPDVTIPNNFSIPEHPEVIKVDKRLLNIEKGLNIDYSSTYIVSVSGSSLSPEYENNDRVLIDTSHTSFKNGYTYLICVNNNYYVVRVNLSPNNIKCIPFDKEQDAFYLTNGGYLLVGMIVPRIRL